PAKWQIDGGAVPVLQPHVAAGDHCKRHDRPPRFPCQHDDAESRDARTFRNVRSERNIIVVIERAHHFLEGADAAFAVESRTMIAGAADRADAEPLDGDAVELAVAMTRDQALGLVPVLGLDERRQEMLAVPERQDRRHARLDALIDVARIKAELVGAPDQTQIFGRQNPDGTLKPAASQRIAKQFLQRAGLVSWSGSRSR